MQRQNDWHLFFSSLGKRTAQYFDHIFLFVQQCQPCINFTPQLVKCYEKIKLDGKKFEIIFSSSDHTEEEFGEYFSTMPWYAIPYRHDASKKLNRMFEVEGQQDPYAPC